jgi:hypothetical protein
MFDWTDACARVAYDTHPLVGRYLTQGSAFMKHRCVICNEHMSEEEISGAIDRVFWEEFDPASVTEEDNWRVTWRDGAGWVHTRCDSVFGTGMTPDETARANRDAWVQSEAYRRLCQDQ